MSIIWVYIKHFLAVAVILLLIGFAVLVSQHGSISMAPDALAYTVDREGPHVFHTDIGAVSAYVRGNREEGFYPETRSFETSNDITLPVYFTAESLTFDVELRHSHPVPASEYSDGQPIIALSDLEGNFVAFKDFLQAHGVVDLALNWTFGKGHLVLIGDMVDRGFSTTQLLWLIYRLEQQAQLAGGHVHYIIGNHELKNLHGDFQSAADKYLAIAGILGKPQSDLFAQDSEIGRWLASKNVIEKINGHLFAHGGLHKDFAQLDLSLDAINAIARSRYRQFNYTQRGLSTEQALITSNQTGVAWYRGYFKGDIEQNELTDVLQTFDASAIVVGHTLQYKVNQQFDYRLFAIDVKHPEDYNTSFPVKRSEGLLIEQQQYYRLLDDGEQVRL